MGTDIAWCGEWTSDRRSPCVFQTKKKEKRKNRTEKRRFACCPFLFLKIVVISQYSFFFPLNSDYPSFQHGMTS